MVSFKVLFLFMIFWSVSAVTNAVLDLTDCPTQTISLHRAVLKDSMIEAFKNPEILRVNLAVTFISNSGKEERVLVFSVMHCLLFGTSSLTHFL